MSERTRLDEIVDHFIKTYKSGNPSFRECLMVSHELAFRHGAEQELADELGRHPHRRAEPMPADRRTDLEGRPGPEQGSHAHLWRDGLPCSFCGAADRRRPLKPRPWVCGAHPFFSGLIEPGSQCKLCHHPEDKPIFQPPVPRFEHTGKFRPPMRGELYLVGNLQEIERAVEDWPQSGEAGQPFHARWILRRVPS